VSHCFESELLSDEEFGFNGAGTAFIDVVIRQEGHMREPRDFETAFRQDFGRLANDGGAREG
jgi:hypothetical protein